MSTLINDPFYPFGLFLEFLDPPRVRCPFHGLTRWEGHTACTACQELFAPSDDTRAMSTRHEEPRLPGTCERCKRARCIAACCARCFEVGVT